MSQTPSPTTAVDPSLDTPKSYPLPLLTTGVLIVVGTLILGYVYLGTTQLPPKTTLGDISVGNHSPEKAIQLYLEQAPQPETFSLISGEMVLASSAATLQLQPNPQYSLQQAYPQNGLDRLQWYTKNLFSDLDLSVMYSYDEQAVQNMYSLFEEAVTLPHLPPTITLKKSGDPNSLEVFPGQQGVGLEKEDAYSQVISAISQGKDSSTLSVSTTGVVLGSEEMNKIASEAASLVGSSITLEAERVQFSLDDIALITLMHPTEELNLEVLKSYVDNWNETVGTKPIEPVLELNEAGTEVITFVPPRNGRAVTADELASVIKKALEEMRDTKTKHITIELPVVETPTATSLADTNNLGIQERIGFGESHYSHSIPNRVHNVAITTQRITNTLVPPGQEFSFNKTVGDVSAATGYKSAYVIKNGKTELGDGGGVCQVSTTLFRSVLNAGLTVSRRLPHSYRVSYYELDNKPGLDATVYTGETDFRFINDTSNYILVHAQADSANTYMYVELYGTSDGRSTKILEHTTWDARKAPPAEYYPDPSLPAGKLVQIDWPASGIRAKVVNAVYAADGTVIREDIYTSNYKPWSAKYLQGTGGQ